MRSKSREALLKIVVGAVVALFVLDRVVLSPAIAGWRDQSERIAALKEKVQRGRQLVDREHSLRARWGDMQRTDLPDDPSTAENDVFKAIGRWGRDSKVGFTNLTRQWRTHEDGYDTLECRAAATGDQASLGRLLYEIEADPLPVRVEECELTARDAQGKELVLSVRFSFIHLSESVRRAGKR